MTYHFRCVDAGAPSCWGSVRASTEQELRDKLAQHLARHGVTVPNETLMDHLIKVTIGRGGSGPRHT
ncbi:MAG: DUF1059 domain-containing protein [Pseudonocardiaceae bacterium]